MQIEDYKQVDQAKVFKKKEFAGTLSRTQHGCVFVYDSSFLANPQEGIAYNIPQSKTPYVVSGVNLPPFFAGLLPEGLRLTSLIEKIKTSPDDLLSLLLAIGSDCIGDISVTPPGESSAQNTTVQSNNLDQIDFYELYKKNLGLDDVNELSHEPAIPGVQEKLSVRRISLPIKIKGKKSKSFILKLNPPSKAKMVENEFFFLNMARACGLNTNYATVIYDKNGNAGLLVERFDRPPAHQEDACQFLDKYPAEKYRVPYADIARGIEKFASAPVIEIAKLIKLIAFSYLIGNGDLHAKNISLRTNPKTNRIELTPAYDLLTTLPYGDRKMALKLDAKDDSLTRAMFVAFGLRFGVREAATSLIIDEICNGAEAWVKRVGEIGFDNKRTADIQRVMQHRLKELSPG
jgi:serine/threonine-protein kinase HipA